MLSILILLFSLGLSSSAPTTIPAAPAADNLSPAIAFGREPPTCTDPARYRTTQDIIWSCLATIFVCTWAVVHPNLPGPYDSRWVKLKRRAIIMTYKMIAPEAVAVWALAQWRAARDIAEEFNSRNGRNDTEYQTPERLPWYSPRKIREWFFGPSGYSSTRWTVTHGFLVQMGGFVLYKGDKPIRVLTYTDLQNLIDKGLVDAPTIREEEIEDKSKGDCLTKLFVILQSTWFVVQCLARWASRLPVTQLEVVTFAFGILNVVTYALWWNKPQNVHVAVAVPLRVIDAQDDGRGLDELVEEDRLFQYGGEKASTVTRQLKELDGEWVRKWLVEVPRWLIGALFRPLAKLGGIDGLSTVHPVSLRVPMFYAERTKGGESLLVLLSGPLIGALNLVSWSARFPTTVECWLWRSSTLIITIEPLIPTLALLTTKPLENCAERLSKLLSRVFVTIFIVVLPLFILARLILVAIALSTLRDLSQDTHITAQWTTFVPHI